MRWTKNCAGRPQPLLKHATHEVEVRESRKLQGQCYYYCVSCGVYVAWLSKQDSEQARQLGLVA